VVKLSDVQEEVASDSQKHSVVIFPPKEFKYRALSENASESEHEENTLRFNGEFRQQIIKEFERTGLDVMIDFNHLSSGGLFNFPSREEGAAAGWITALRDGGDEKGLIAEIEWTDLGKQAVKSGQYRYMSPEFTMRSYDKATGKTTKSPRLYALALTNRPFLEQQQALAASEIIMQKLLQQEHLIEEDEKHMAEEENVEDIINDAEEKALDALAAQKKALEALAGVEEAEDPEEEPVATPEDAKVEEQQVMASEIAKLKLEAEVAKAALAEIRKTQKQDAITHAMSEGRVVPSMLQVVQKYADACGDDVGALKTFLNSLPNQVRAQAIGVDAENSKALTLQNATQAERKLAQAFGLTAEEVEKWSGWHSITADGKFRNAEGEVIASLEKRN
jgi:phage I-like protein